MQRIIDEFEQSKKKKLVPFITAGDPSIEMTLHLMETMVSAGADIIELGVPFSDPMADGPVIQRASDRALMNNVGLQDIFGLVKDFRARGHQTPIVLMGYLNPIEHMGITAFSAAAQDAGVDGVLIVDLPPEEAKEMAPILSAHQLALIFLVSPTTTPERMAQIAEHASGYLYYVSLRGVTGASNLNIEEVESKIAELKSHTALPVLVGFGIKDAETAKNVAPVAEGVVMGSALVETIEKQCTKESASEQQKQRCLEAVSDLIGTVKTAITETEPS